MQEVKNEQEKRGYYSENYAVFNFRDGIHCNYDIVVRDIIKFDSLTNK